MRMRSFTLQADKQETDRRTANAPANTGDIFDALRATRTRDPGDDVELAAEQHRHDFPTDAEYEAAIKRGQQLGEPNDLGVDLDDHVEPEEPNDYND